MPVSHRVLTKFAQMVVSDLPLLLAGVLAALGAGVVRRRTWDAVRLDARGQLTEAVKERINQLLEVIGGDTIDSTVHANAA
jgi:hypothetical protein